MVDWGALPTTLQVALGVGAAVFLLTLVQFALAFVVLERGGRQPAARFLAAYLILQVFAWGVVAGEIQYESDDVVFQGALVELGIGDGYLGIFVFPAVAFAVLPTLLLGFATTFPAPGRSFRRRRWFLLIPAAISALLAGRALWFAPLGVRQGPMDPAFLDVYLLAHIYLGVSAVLAALILVWRHGRAPTSLARARIGFVLRWILTPTILGGMLLLGVAFLAPPTVGSEAAFLVITWMVTLGFAAVAIVPPIGFTYGLLRDRVLDLDRRVRTGLRYTVRGGFLTAVFFVVFVAMGETVEAVVEGGTGSKLVGLAAAALVTFALRPVQVAARRLAARAVPEDQTSPDEDRLRIYRATYEDVVRDGAVTAKERRTLQALAVNLGLSRDATDRIEAGVGAELQVGLGRPTGVVS